MTNDHDVRSLYCLLPSLNDLLFSPEFTAMLQAESRSTVVRSTRDVLLRIKQEISDGQHTHASLSSRVAGLDAEVITEIARNRSNSLRRVINATGVILHTNLGELLSAPPRSNTLSRLLQATPISKSILKPGNGAVAMFTPKSCFYVLSE